MIIKINGIEIQEGTSGEEFNQLVEGIGSLGLDTFSERFEWLSDLSFNEYMEMMEIIYSFGLDSAIDFFGYVLK